MRLFFLCGGFVTIAAANALQPQHLEKHVIDAAFTNGYQVSVADINGDGKPDVIALSTDPSRLVWFRNPDWQRYDVTTETQRNIDVAPYDVDNDGDVDLALACEFSLSRSTEGGAVLWLEHPANAESEQEWAIHRIDAVPTAHRLRWANVLGDERLELLNLPIVGIGAKAPEYAGGVQFKAYAIPVEPKNAVWPASIVSDALEMAHGMEVVQWNDAGPMEILTASFGGVHLHEKAADTRFSSALIGAGHDGARPARGSSEVALGMLRSKYGRYIAAIEPWHGNEVVVYDAEDASKVPWNRWVIDDSLVDGHALACIDIDGDGNDEIAAGCRGGDRALRVYQFAAGSAEWERTIIDKGGIAAAGFYAADINQDGATDLVATGTGTNNVVWYENRFGKSE